MGEVIEGSPRARAVLAPNPGPMTLDGTNTWVLAEPGAPSAVVVDPGPLDEGHLRRVADLARVDGREVAVIVLTHRHHDHTEGAQRFSEMVGAPVRAADPAYRIGPDGLAEGDVLEIGGLEVRVLATPGHTSDSCCLHLPADGVLLTGDTVLGRGTTVLAEPDGRLDDYLATLRRLSAYVTEHGIGVLLPAHGPVRPDAGAVLDGYLRHRQERLEQVRAAVRAGRTTAAEVTAAVYDDIDPAAYPAAEQSVRAQLTYLRDRGEL